MTSYISSFKSLIAALCLLAVGESAIALLGSPRPLYGSALYEMGYGKTDVPQKFVIEGKFTLFRGIAAEFIQVGDSSGLFGVSPRDVMWHLPGQTYLNYSCCADVGFTGYRYIAEAALRDNPARKVLVLYMTVFSLPRLDSLYAKLTDELRESLIGVGRYVGMLPSAPYRRAVTNLAYHGKLQQIPIPDPFFGWPNFPTMQQWVEQFGQTLGWVPFPPVIGDVPVGPCKLDPVVDKEGHPVLLRELEETKKLADRYQVKLVIAFNPVACDGGETTRALEDQVAEFRRRHADVFIPFGPTETIDAVAFSDQMHLRHIYATPNSQHLGAALAGHDFSR